MHSQYPTLSRRSQSSIFSHSHHVSREELLNSIHSITTPTSLHSRRPNPNNESQFRYYLNTSKSERCYDKFHLWLYNPAKHEFMGRTWIRWIQIIAFFCIFYGILAVLVYLYFALFMHVAIMADYPRLTGMQSALKLNPGLGVVPQPDSWTSLIAFRTRKDSFQKYVDDIVAFTQWYEDYGPSHITSPDNKLDAASGGFAKCPRSPVEAVTDDRRSCRQTLDIGGRCNIHQYYGYMEGRPCVLLTLNRIYGWLPDPLDNHTGVLVRCYGAGKHDQDLLGKICYHDDNDPNGRNLCANDYGEFKSYYFPYLKQLTYQSPLVMVEFRNPARNTIIMIECRTYAKNIIYDRQKGEGLVRFELLVD